MLKVTLENIKRLRNFLQKPTSEYGRGAQNFYIGRDVFLMPIHEISVSALSTGEDYSIRAVISTQSSAKTKIVNGKKVQRFLPLTPIMTFLPPLSLPEGYKEVRINLNTIKITDKDGVTQYAIHIYEEGYPAIISAGEEAVPSGVTKKLTTPEEFEKDIILFAQIMESFVNGIYTTGVFMAEAMLVDLKKDEKNKKFVEEFKEIANKIANTNQFLRIRAPIFSDEKLEDAKSEDNNPPDPPPPPQLLPHQKPPDHVGKHHKFFKPEDLDICPDDVAGLDPIKEEVQEMIDFVKNPAKYDALGAEVSRGTLFTGPPGCGKTLLAKLIAKLAGLNFISMEGSAFVEVFVGVAASRVRGMYEDAEKNQPCIVFIDEIDSFAKIRTSSGGGEGEREQGLNQLLAEMDGFKKSRNIITIAATNRPDILDPAILDRFANRITIPRPDVQARIEILASHARKKIVSPDVDWKKVSRSIFGFSGRDIRNLLNRAALMAVKRNKTSVEEIDILDARDIIKMGREHRIPDMLPHELRSTAYHEAGHALIAALYLGILDPLYKVTIIPRDIGALGLTVSIPDKDKYQLTKEEILIRVRMSLGGRAAEIILTDGHSNHNKGVSTGASHDIKYATQLIYEMVTEDGLSDEMGPVNYGSGSRHQNLGYFIPGQIVISEATQREIDMNVKFFMNNAQEKAEKTLRKHWNAVVALANLLLEKETVTGEEVMQIIRDNPPVDENNHPPPVIKLPVRIIS